MKKILSAAAVLAILAAGGMLAAQGSQARSGDFQITASTTEASGALSTGGGFELRSVVGQPIAELSAPSTGGGFELQSGFLAAAAEAPPPSSVPGWDGIAY